MVYIVMGVSGCGKSTIGSMLAQRLQIPFLDADRFHPPENVEKMSRAIPLTDGDREPWLKILSMKIRDSLRAEGAVLACSALKEKYRIMLRGNSSKDVTFIYLKGSKDLIYTRIRERTDHYMPSTLLDSQFEALEEPVDALTVAIEGTPIDICEAILKKICNHAAVGTDGERANK